MKLYAVVGSPNCRKVRAAINHLGIDVEIEYLDFFTGDLESADYLGLNPNAMVPTLQDEEFVLWESNAIMQYLANLVPGNSLFPHDVQVRADITRWQCWELAHYNKAFGVLALEAIAKPTYMQMEGDPAIIAWAGQELARFAKVLEGHLENREYAVGDDVTLADYSLIHIEAFKEAIPFDWSPYPNVNAYYQRIAALPYWADTAPESPDTVGKRPAA